MGSSAPAESGARPSAPEVMRRALVLSALACRAHVELAPRIPEAQSVYRDLQEWLRKCELLRGADPEEERLLTSPQVSLDPKSQVRASWSAEGLVFIAWALHLAQLSSTSGTRRASG